MRHTKKCLDRAFSNQAWIVLCTSLSCTTITKKCSDHFPILMTFDYKEISHPSQFKFMQMWAMHDDFKDIVAKSWETNVVGRPMFILDRKLKILKDKLKVWNKSSFGNIHVRVKDGESNLNRIQQRTATVGHSKVTHAYKKISQKDISFFELGRSLLEGKIQNKLGL